MTEFEPNIAVLGGGTGSFTLLQELKHSTPNISAVVNMCDDGGSTGILRDELGVLPMGDVRQCLVALSNKPDARERFNYRYCDGNLKGHSFGNLVLANLELTHKDFVKAVRLAGEMLDITGEVLPVTTDNHTLVMDDGGEVVRGEYVIGHRAIKNRDAQLHLQPSARLHPAAEESLLNADIIAIAPGNLYGSLLPIFAVEGVQETVRDSRAQTVMIANLVTKPGQTTDWHIVDYVKEFEKYLGEDSIDVVLYNNNLPNDELLAKYAADGEFPVDIEANRLDEVHADVIGDNLLASDVFVQDPNDKAIRRTLIRHDAAKVSRLLLQIHKEQKSAWAV